MRTYETPEMELVYFETEDVITSSLPVGPNQTPWA